MIFFKKKINNYLLLLFFFLLIISLLIFKDFGISIDEPSTRVHGLVSFNYILSTLNNLTFFNFEETKDLPQLHQYIFKDYGVFFEIILILIEKIFKLENFSEIFYLRHFITNLFFIFSILIFAKIIFKITNDFNFSLFGCLILYTTPRIFANSFYNNKDLIFLSFFIFSIYFILTFLKKRSLKNLILATLSVSILTSIRVIGVYLLFLFLFFLIIEFFEKRKDKSSLIDIFKIIFFFLIFIYLSWPFLWENPISNFLYSFKNMINYPWGGSVFYFGEYNRGSHLPWHYLFVWIIASNPIGIVLIFLASLMFVTLRFSKRLLKIEEGNYINSLWKKNTEMFLYFNLAAILIPVFLIIINSSTIYNGWRHLYFIYPSMIILVTYSLYFFNKVILKQKYKKPFYVLLTVLVLINLNSLIKYHPYQNVYFNKFFENRANKIFEIDYWGLSNVDALRKMSQTNDIIKVCNLGLMDLTSSKDMLSDDLREKIIINGQKFQSCSHIISNNIYVHDPKFTKKYRLPDNFKIDFQIKRGNIIINEILVKK